jgi:2Fe-2S ferredoxin
MPRLMITTYSGEVRTVNAANNMTVLEAIRDDGVADLLALCGGCCSCGTCHVYVDPLRASHLPPISEDEDALLDGSDHRRPSSRLSCQLRMSDALDGLHVVIAPQG